MADDFGRVNLTPHILDRDAREERYPGRHARKHGHERGSGEIDTGSVAEEDPEAPDPRNRIDLRA
jgi:hypothetical protein